MTAERVRRGRVSRRRGEHRPFPFIWRFSSPTVSPSAPIAPWVPGVPGLRHSAPLGIKKHIKEKGEWKREKPCIYAVFMVQYVQSTVQVQYMYRKDWKYDYY